MKQSFTTTYGTYAISIKKELFERLFYQSINQRITISDIRSTLNDLLFEFTKKHHEHHDSRLSFVGFVMSNIDTAALDAIHHEMKCTNTDLDELSDKQSHIIANGIALSYKEAIVTNHKNIGLFKSLID